MSLYLMAWCMLELDSLTSTNKDVLWNTATVPNPILYTTKKNCGYFMFNIDDMILLRTLISILAFIFLTIYLAELYKYNQIIRAANKIKSNTTIIKDFSNPEQFEGKIVMLKGKNLQYSTIDGYEFLGKIIQFKTKIKYCQYVRECSTDQDSSYCYDAVRWKYYIGHHHSNPIINETNIDSYLISPTKVGNYAISKYILSKSTIFDENFHLNEKQQSLFSNSSLLPNFYYIGGNKFYAPYVPRYSIDKKITSPKIATLTSTQRYMIKKNCRPGDTLVKFEVARPKKLNVVGIVHNGTIKRFEINGTTYGRASVKESDVVKILSGSSFPVVDFTFIFPIVFFSACFDPYPSSAWFDYSMIILVSKSILIPNFIIPKKAIFILVISYIYLTRNQFVLNRFIISPTLYWIYGSYEIVLLIVRLLKRFIKFVQNLTTKILSYFRR